LNPQLERFMHSMKCECLNRMLFSGEKSLRKALTEFNAYYHEECNHHGLDNTFVVPGKEVGGTDKKVVCRNPSTACSATTTAKPLDQLPLVLSVSQANYAYAMRSKTVARTLAHETGKSRLKIKPTIGLKQPVSQGCEHRLNFLAIRVPCLGS